jgi:hypothetical protein
VWLAHDHPERPLAYGAWLCCCLPCAFALAAAATADPTLTIVIKSCMGRTVLKARDVAFGRSTGTFDDLLPDDNDQVREVFVGRPGLVPEGSRSSPDPPPTASWPACPRCTPELRAG